ncbi:hypothetical protein CF319_g5953 [Tilletia indica]|nr:hypothetical protein CF319_g5953 [Tilletia indica]
MSPTSSPPGSGHGQEDEAAHSSAPSSSPHLDTTLYRRMFNGDLEFGNELRMLRTVARQLGFDPTFPSLVQRHLDRPEPPNPLPPLTHTQEAALPPFQRFEYIDTRLGTLIRALQRAGEDLGFVPNWRSMIARHLGAASSDLPSPPSPSATNPPPSQLTAAPSATAPRPGESTATPSAAAAPPRIHSSSAPLAATPTRSHPPSALPSVQPTSSSDRTHAPPTPSFRGRGFIPAGVLQSPSSTSPSTFIAPRNTAVTPNIQRMPSTSSTQSAVIKRKVPDSPSTPVSSSKSHATEKPVQKHKRKSVTEGRICGDCKAGKPKWRRSKNHPEQWYCNTCWQRERRQRIRDGLEGGGDSSGEEDDNEEDAPAEEDAVHGCEEEGVSHGVMEQEPGQGNGEEQESGQERAGEQGIEGDHQPITEGAAEEEEGAKGNEGDGVSE